MSKQQGKYEQYIHHSRKRLIIAFMAILLLAGGTILWILSLLDTIQWAWSNILPAIFTLLGVAFTLLQWLLPFSPPVSPIAEDYSINEPINHETKNTVIQVKGIDLGISSQSGALIIYTKKIKLGESIDLRRNHILLLSHSTSSIVRRVVNNQIVYAAIFPYLEPSDYVACDTAENFSTKVTVLPNQVTEIDWRNRKSKREELS